MEKSIKLSWTFWVYMGTFLIAFTITERFWISLGIAVSMFALSMTLENLGYIKELRKVSKTPQKSKISAKHNSD